MRLVLGTISRSNYIVYTDATLNAKDKVQVDFPENYSAMYVKKGTYKKCTRSESKRKLPL